jgi:hypothetical protein
MMHSRRPPRRADGRSVLKSACAEFQPLQTSRVCCLLVQIYEGRDNLPPGHSVASGVPRPDLLLTQMSAQSNSTAATEMVSDSANAKPNQEYGSDCRSSIHGVMKSPNRARTRTCCPFGVGRSSMSR